MLERGQSLTLTGIKKPANRFQSPADKHNHVSYGMQAEPVVELRAVMEVVSGGHGHILI